MRTTLKNQRGFTLTPALFILSLVMIAGTTYLLYINSIGKTALKIEKSQSAKYAAEVGLNQIKSQLMQLSQTDAAGKPINEWYNARAFDYTPANKKFIFKSTTPSPITEESLRTLTNTERFSGPIQLKGAQNQVVAEYKITIEDGSILANSKTISGSSIIGKDKYNNDIWSNSTDKNYFKNEQVFRYGIRVDGYSVNSGKPDKNNVQSIYAALDIPVVVATNDTEGWGPGSPSGFLLSTNGHESMISPTADRYLTLIGGQVITGKIHTNDQLFFKWNGNWDTGLWKNWYSADPYIEDTPAAFRNSAVNNNYTVLTKRGSTSTADASPVLIKKVGIEYQFSSSPKKLTIYGLNFDLDPAKNEVKINNVAVTGNIEVTEYTQPADPPLFPVDTLTNVVTRMRISMTSFPTLPFTITIKNLNPNRLQTLKYKVQTLPNLDNDLPINTKEKPLRIYGIMQVKVDGTTPYESGTDYRFAGPPTYNYFNGSAYFYDPYIYWVGSKPANNSYYSITYITENNIPHNLIKSFDEITYSGASPSLSYIHSHKVEGTTGFSLKPFSGTHGHDPVFGMSGLNLLDANAPNDYFRSAIGYYDWEYFHQHVMNPIVLNYNPSLAPYKYQEDLFFYWGNIGFRPKSVPAKLSPILSPNAANFLTQRFYADQIFKTILGKGLTKSVNGNLASLDEISENRELGYYNLNGGMIDFGSTYFGNDLIYTAGTSVGSLVLPANSPIITTKGIYVNEDSTSTDYLKVSDSILSPSYKYYTYRQIPRNASSVASDNKTILDGGIIFVRNGVIRIGGASYKGTVAGTGYTKSATFGKNTIIDGRLSIISYTEDKPLSYIDNDTNNSTDNKGDIVITGNVIYKNKINPWESSINNKSYTHRGFRQYNSSVVSAPSNIDDEPVPHIYTTAKDGKILEPSDMLTNGKVDALALVASNDIKIPVMHYHQPDAMENHYTDSNQENISANNPNSFGCPCKDTLTVMGQLIAGHKITQTKVNDGVTSKNDRIIMYGSFYSYYPPDLSYFDRTDPSNTSEDGLGRMYLYDNALAQSQLTGTPSFPKDNTYSSTSYPVSGAQLPRIVPGTWKVVSDGTQ